MIFSLQPFNRSLYRQFRLVFSFITLFVFLVAAPALIVTQLSSGSGGAINVSGSLRMMSYKLTVAVSNPYARQDERRQATEAAVREFGERLSSPGLLNEIPESSQDQLRQMYSHVEQAFEQKVRPLALDSIEDEAARRSFMAGISSFVDEVDAFVAALEARLNRRLWLLKGMLSATLAGALLLTWSMLRVMRRRIFEPLAGLERAVEAVRHGDFSSRTCAVDGTEIGRLGRGFNFMVSELERLYSSLEDEVKKKTADLDRRNRGLQFLATASQMLLSESGLTEALRRTLNESLDFMDAKSAAVVMKVENGSVAEGDFYTLASSAGWVETSLESAYVVPLLDDEGREVGRFLALLEDGRTALPEWRTSFINMLAGLIGRAVVTSLRRLDDRRLAVLEERATIARELHDSIAQTLSFSRIQILRLKHAVSNGASKEAQEAILVELDEGVATAYRQLREVLTAFRLQIHGAGLAGAIADVAEQFRMRTGIAVKIDNRTVGVELSPNEQVHLVQILREALSNVEKHARATEVEIHAIGTADGRLLLEVLDNGIGIPDVHGKPNHFGLSIMKERAQALGANIEIARRPAPMQGTSVRIVKRTAGRGYNAGSSFDSARHKP